MHLKKIKNKNKKQKNTKGKKVACSPICAFSAFLCVKFSRKKQRSLKLSEQTKTNKTAFLCTIKTSKRKKVACLTFCAFYVFCAFYAFCTGIKRLSESRLFMFCTFCIFCAF